MNKKENHTTSKSKVLFSTKKYKEFEKFHRQVTNYAPVKLWITNEQGSCIYLNNRWYDYTGQAPDTPEEDCWMQAVHEKDIGRVKNAFEKAVQKQESFETVHRLKNKSGDYRWHLAEGNPLFDENGDFEGLTGTITDIHKQKFAKESLMSKLKKQGAKLNQMNVLRENLLHIIRHDLRGPVGNIKLGLELLPSVQDEQGKNEIIKGLTRSVEKQQKVVDGITKIITVQNPNDVEFKQVNLEEIMHEVIHMYQDFLSENDEINYNFKEVSVIRYVPSFAFSILKNLVSNAVKYRQEDRPLKVNVKSERKDNFVLLTVQDNGIGIDLKRYKNDLFHVFRRLTDKADGIGIGLYIIKNLIEGNGGFIDVKSEPGKGSTFSCYLKEYN
ncbi:MAG: sensor histidine kinase [Prolixibacteraceae bacterium]